MKKRIWLAVLAVAGGGLYLETPKLDGNPDFSGTPALATLEDEINARETITPNIIPDLSARILWAGERATKTDLSIVYLHGFSASNREISPVVDRIAADLGANAYLARFSGHGRDAKALGAVTAGDWLEDAARAMVIGRALGDEVIVIGASNGAAVAVKALETMPGDFPLAGFVQLSPNYRINNSRAFALTLPLAYRFVPLVLGDMTGFTPTNDLQAEWWTERYPSTTLIEPALGAQAARSADLEHMPVPALFLYNPDDTVIDPEAVIEAAGRWGTETGQDATLTTFDTDDPAGHTLAGRALSPDTNDALVEIVTDWVKKTLE